MQPVTQPTVKVQLLCDEAQLPVRKHATDAGMDIHSCEEILIKAFDPNGPEEGHRVMVRTGLAFGIPYGTGMFIWDRSGMAAKHGIHRVAGVLDESYTGELKIALVNLSNKDYLIKVGDRIAQAVISPVLLPTLKQVDLLEETIRGSGGFGSTGR